MLSDEEREALRNFKSEYETCDHYSSDLIIELDDAETILNLIEKQQKEIEELSDKLTQKICKGVEEEILEEYRQTIISKDKEIEELKEDRKKYAEEYIHNNPWLYKQLNENYILRVEAEQKEKQAWIEGTNVADKLCNKKWEAKINAKIEDLKENSNGDDFNLINVIMLFKSLLEKE